MTPVLSSLFLGSSRVITDGRETRLVGWLKAGYVVVLDATAHALKFATFQQMYFENRFPPAFEIVPKKSLQNAPRLVRPKGLDVFPSADKPLEGKDFERFVQRTVQAIADKLKLTQGHEEN